MLTPFAFQSSCYELNSGQIVLTKLILICCGHVKLNIQLKQSTDVSVVLITLELFLLQSLISAPLEGTLALFSSS